MAYDPDLGSNQNSSQITSFVSGGGGSMGQAYSTPSSSKAGVGSLLMAIFAGLNLLFLIVAALYSLGIFENVEATSDGATFFIVALMTFIAGGLGLFCSYVGMRMSRLANAPVFTLIHKILFLAIIVVASLVLIGPVFN